MRKILPGMAMLFALLMILLAAPAVGEERDVELFLNSRETFCPIYTGTQRAYTFTPDSGGVYIFRGFPAGEISAPVYARLYNARGDMIGNASGSGAFVIEAALAEGEPARLVVSSYNTAVNTRVEVMASVYGRCFNQPARLGSGSVSYNRAVVRPRDTHWYAYVPDTDGWYVVRTESAGRSALDTNGCVVDDAGRVIAENDDVLFPSDGNFRMCLYLYAGKQYYIRVSAASNATGSYRLIVAAPEKGARLPIRMTLSEAAVTVKIGEKHALTSTILPDVCQDDQMWISENSAVASVSNEGVITGVSAGETYVHVYAGRLEALCRVTVPETRASSIFYGESQISLREGDTASAAPIILPENAAVSLRYESADESVARVDQSGVLTAVSAGETVVTVRDDESGLSARATVIVTTAGRRCRALVLGEQNYAAGRTRVGGLNTAQGVADMLAEQDIDGEKYAVTLRMDVTREELITAISETFAGATDKDLSLFYINCHGDYDGSAYIELHDGTRVTAAQLELLLRRIPGKVVVIMDCCRSGGFLADAGRFAGAVQLAFSKPNGPLTDDKYIVLTSAGADQDSYRRSFAEGDGEESMATIMARALCEGAGWDLIGNRIGTLKADADKNRQITLQEIYLYLSRRVMYYLEGTGVEQTVCVWPEGDQTVLFGRAK